jgi:hypothetical protein
LTRFKYIQNHGIASLQLVVSDLSGLGLFRHSREAVWDALKRKEAYCTTGDRPVVRLFAGWDFAPADLYRHDFAENGYAHGVPMGGDLTKAPEGKNPAFMVYALRDPDGPNLDRIQIIKGWLAKDGTTGERIFDVAVSGKRTIARDGRCKTSVGSTVDVANATYNNSIGAPRTRRRSSRQLDQLTVAGGGIFLPRVVPHCEGSRWAASPCRLVSRLKMD